MIVKSAVFKLHDFARYGAEIRLIKKAVLPHMVYIFFWYSVQGDNRIAYLESSIFK
jgi:hypothetical protein